MSEPILETFETKGVAPRLAKAMEVTHSLSRFGRPSIDMVLRAMDSLTTGEGKDWIATGFSPDVIEQVVLMRKVAQLFDRVKMPNNPYIFPVQGGRPTAYLMPENTADTSQTVIPATNAATTNVTFTAKKLAALVRVSDELEQDAIVDMIPYVQKMLLMGMTDAEENALINGDTTVTHMDSDTTASTDARKAFKGLRYYGLNGPAAAKVNLGTFNDANVLGVLSGMGRYAYNPADVVWITSMNGFNKMRTGLANILTWDKLGPQAVMLSGQLGSYYGSPVVVSEYVRQDLNATGVFDNVTTTKTTIMAVHKSAFRIGDRQQVQLIQDNTPRELGQTKLISNERIDFQPFFPYATEAMVGIGYNV